MPRPLLSSLCFFVVVLKGCCRRAYVSRVRPFVRPPLKAGNIWGHTVNTGYPRPTAGPVLQSDLQTGGGHTRGLQSNIERHVRIDATDTLGHHQLLQRNTGTLVGASLSHHGWTPWRALARTFRRSRVLRHAAEVPEILTSSGDLRARVGVGPPGLEDTLELQHFADRGLGWVAKRAIAQGELLLTVPLNQVLVAPLSDDSEAQLAACLLQVHGQGPRLDGEPGIEPADPVWCEYTQAAFPPKVTAAALTWSEEDILALEWPAVINQFGEYAMRLHESAARVAEYLGVSLERARWAVNAVVSRSFDVDGLGRVLVPFADLFNDKPMASATWSARKLENPEYPFTAWRLSEDRQSIEMRAMENFDEGQEVTICYGEGSTAEVLAVHGYIPLSNEANFVNLFNSPAELVKTVAKIAGCQHSMDPRLELLEGFTNAEAALAIRDGGMPPSSHLLSSIEVAIAETAEFYNFQEVWSKDAGHSILAPPDSMAPARRRELRKKAINVAKVMITGALRHMTPAIQDKEELNRLNANPGQASEASAESPNRRLILSFRLGLKKMLQDFRIQANAIEAMEEMEASQQSGSNGSNGGDAKSAK